MIDRTLLPELLAALHESPAVALLGPRQVGKTTLARVIAARLSSSPVLPEYLDLENPVDAAKLEDAGAYLRSRSDRLMIIDEVHRAPELFRVLRGIIDDRLAGSAGAGRFLLLGSASIELLRQSSESLAGRVSFLELAPFRVGEVPADVADVSTLWLRGGFPRSLLAASDRASATWRANFISTYLERDIPQLGPRVAAETLRRFWTMLAHLHGSVLNAADLARSLAVDGRTIGRYLDLLVDLLLVRRLQPYHANAGKRLVRSPKVYLRDSGLVHALLRLDTFEAVMGHPIVGASWEGFVLENLLRAAPSRTQATFYRTLVGAEADLVLDLPDGRRWVVEVKRSTAPKVERGFRSALQDLAPTRAFIVHGGDEHYPKGDGIEAIGLPALAGLLSAQSAPIL
jgi:uncharacterized protein